MARRIRVRLSAGGAGESPFASSAAKHEAVDRRVCPRRVAHLGKRRRRSAERRPSTSCRVRRGLRGRGAPQAHPFRSTRADRRDLRILQLAGRRHAQRVGLPHRTQQQALRGLPGNDRRPASSALEHGLAAVEPQTAHGRRRRGVAGQALPRQHGPDILLEEIGAVLLRADSANASGQQHQPAQPNSHPDGQYTPAICGAGTRA